MAAKYTMLSTEKKMWPCKCENIL